MHKRSRSLMFFIYTLAAIYILIASGLYVFQRKVMYLPDTNIASPAQYGLSDFEDGFIAAEDGTRLQIWHKKPESALPTILYFHGNAGHLGMRAGIYQALAEKGFGVLALSYRGYGKSQGNPTEEGIYNDARAAIRFLTDTQKIPLTQMILFGESLGTGVTVQMATEFPVSSVVLEAPYTSVVNRAAEIYFYIPVRWLIKDHFDSISKVPHIKMPVMVFHGELDSTIPIAHGKALFAAIQSPKKSFYFPHVNHTDFDSNVLAAHIVDFAKEYHIIGE